MTLNELCEAVGMPARQIRYLIAEGALPSATGTGRGADAYTDEHLRLARDCKRLLDANVGVRALKGVLAAEARDVLYRDARVELRLRTEATLADLSDSEIRALVDDIERAVRRAAEGRLERRDMLADEREAD